MGIANKTLKSGFSFFEAIVKGGVSPKRDPFWRSHNKKLASAGVKFSGHPRFHSNTDHSTNMPGSASYDPSKGSHIAGHGADAYVPPGGRIF